MENEKLLTPENIVNFGFEEDKSKFNSSKKRVFNSLNYILGLVIIFRKASDYEYINVYKTYGYIKDDLTESLGYIYLSQKKFITLSEFEAFISFFKSNQLNDLDMLQKNSQEKYNNLASIK